MGSSYRVLARMQSRVARLSANLPEYLAYFRNNETFIGPSMYFHNKALEIREACGTVAAILQSDQFFDYLYATLTAWGMHRMGPGYTKLGSIDDLRSSFRAQTHQITRMQHLALLDIDSAALPATTSAVWNVLSNLKVSLAEAQIVANSKALHHVLPALVPPIDRSYTYIFLYGRSSLSIDEDDAFKEIYASLHQIASRNAEQIRAATGADWNTSETKTIDNAIVGFVKKELRVADSDLGS